jgi:hypothetical protein
VLDPSGDYLGIVSPRLNSADRGQMDDKGGLCRQALMRFGHFIVRHVRTICRQPDGSLKETLVFP